MKIPRVLSQVISAGAIAFLSAACQPKASDTIRIGEIASLTGKEATFGTSSHEGTVLAVEEINAAGGVLGKRLELVTEDNQSKAGESATAAQKLITRDRVVALIGEVASSRSLEIAPIAQQNRVPQITPSSTNPAVTETGEYVFRVCFIDPFQGTVMAQFSRETLKVRRVAMMTSVSSAYSVGLAKYFRERFLADGGQIVAEQRFSEGDKDFKAQLTAIRAQQPEAIFVPGYYTEAALICVQARQLGIQVPLFGGDGWEAPELIEIGKEAVEGTYYSTHFSPENETAEVRAFVERYKARFGGKVPDAMAALGYDAARIVADALRRAGEADPVKLRDALAATKDFPGVTGVTTIDGQRNATKAAVILTVKDGAIRFVQAVNP